MQYTLLTAVGFYTFVSAGQAHEINPIQSPPVTIQTIDSDQLVGQFWLQNPTPIEAVVLKRRQRAKK
jgi:hypothetical protein